MTLGLHRRAMRSVHRHTTVDGNGQRRDNFGLSFTLNSPYVVPYYDDIIYLMGPSTHTTAHPPTTDIDRQGSSMSAVGTPRLPEPTRRPHRWRSAVAGFPTLLGTSTADALFSILGKPITEEFG